MAEQLFVLHGHSGGVTQVQFSRDGTYLYSGARKDGNILCWDVRFTIGEVYRLARDTNTTNQRIAFDIEPGGRHLATGGEDGKVRVFDLATGELKTSFWAAPDAMNGFGFHPMLPLVATASGERRFDVWDEEDGEDGEETEAEGGRRNFLIKFSKERKRK
jgi:WD40 repeat protein